MAALLATNTRDEDDMPLSDVEVVKPGDERYTALTASFNGRWAGTPDYVLVPATADEAVDAVQHVIDNGDRFAIHSSGACYEDLLTNQEVRALISTSQLRSVEFDPERSAFAVGPGISTVELYTRLYEGWHVTVPAGAGPPVALAGQMTNAGYGPLSRQLGQLVDHLEAVEVVVVDGDGRARKVVAGRNPDDENHDLWWAHTGGGGGTFGLVTKFWLRSPDAEGDDPAAQLPRAPRELIVSETAWSWDAMTEKAFTRLLKNFSAWHEANSVPGSRAANLFGALKPRHVSAGEFLMSTELDAATSGAEELLDEFLAAVVEGTGLTYREERRTVDWLGHVTAWAGLGGDGWEGKGRFKAKSAYLRTAFPDEQLRAIYRHLTDPDFDNPATMVEIGGYGGAVNAIDASATAVGQRDSVLRLLYLTMWADEADDAAHLAWLRRWYADVHASTGGVPDRRGAGDGAILNYIDADLLDETLNTSGVAWHELYFGSAYPRLQRIKSRWDPQDVFTHALAVRRPD
ncbi:FAD-binding oxidoreductase [Myceligenerans pegani]|uniref:FAD-binding oxidoreductase n=1 Tax=Myceligenerans pegani TaxID=2776917 RepID=A0ABR9MVH3_9MICO|nr:FAD-binding protein [Myceligenerans sp. TRM 65318]MBE1875383.1 FAD-binding oxidoreductase [Myceligenerans sp. TRM 65318]MBE3017654.1 FAD-binding oxidoreductase [Myceligenerans sp. TRM 65318]